MLANFGRAKSKQQILRKRPKASDLPKIFTIQMNKYKCLTLGIAVLYQKMSRHPVHVSDSSPGGNGLSQENIWSPILWGPSGEEVDVSGTGQRRNLFYLDFTPK